ncbi:Sn1-specific diacylglycerol lipase alpha [Fragariocoptes setiger]|uniref:sn-1-specific diacylglycerol lipase n=1 Tax=Fragariocoptes setiger TaxID=1670756 RepID=A0ABQ7S8E9_9ACAR|nr:Sn1-specific diacylglycerol lipase alpha [Fragariocoptes setiger]
MHNTNLAVHPVKNLNNYNNYCSRDTMMSTKHHKKWNRRLKIIFCCLGYKKNKDSFADIASIFAEFFSDLDVTPMDLAAGFVILSKLQESQRDWNVKNNYLSIEKYLSSTPITPDTVYLDITDADDSHLMNELIYYMNYSLAIFGWPLQLINNPFQVCCICPYLKLAPCCGRRGRKSKQPKVNEQPSDNNPTSNVNNTQASNQQTASTQYVPGQLNEDCDTPIVLEDNCCSCNYASVESRLSSHNYDIIYMTYHVDISRVPFLVAADHSKQTIVIAMRGSMSLDDMITDMNGQIDKLPIDNCPDDWLCHRGISRAAAYVKQKLIDDGILARAFDSRPDLGSHDYNLMLCGHSLGAGAAAILGILLRQDYPDLRAFLYSPPGGILSLPVVEYTKQFAVSVILGNDCVPRLGVAQFERLRYHVLLSLKNSRQSTRRILTSAICSCCTRNTKTEYDPNTMLDFLHGLDAPTFEFDGCNVPFQVQPLTLFVPGRILHIVKNYSVQSRTKRIINGPLYQAVWTENLMYDRVIVGDGMFFDHLPNNLMHAMKMLFTRTVPVRRNSKEKTPRNSMDAVVETPKVHIDDNNRDNTITADMHIYEAGVTMKPETVEDDKEVEGEDIVDPNNNSNCVPNQYDDDNQGIDIGIKTQVDVISYHNS